MMQIRLQLTTSLSAPGLVLAVFLPLSAWAQSDQGDPVVQELTRDVTPGALLVREAGEVTLVSTEDGATLIGKIGWMGNRFQLGLEASSKLQEGAEEVELLNLDGVAGGATVTGQVSFRPRGRTRKADRFSSACAKYRELVACNLILDRSTNSRGARRTRDDCLCAKPGSVKPIASDACTLPALIDIGPPWDERGGKAQDEALTAACAALADLTGDPPLPTDLGDSVNAVGPFPAPAVCNHDGFVSAAKGARDAWLAKRRAGLKSQANALETDSQRLTAIGDQEADPGVKAHILARAVEALSGAIKAKAEAQALEAPALLAKPEEWLAAKQSENLDKVCRQFNTPSSKFFFDEREGKTECDREALFARAENLPKKQASWLRRYALKQSNWIPWIFTLRGSATRQSFSFVEVSDLDTKIKQSENNTSIGLYASTLFEGTFYSLGIERKREFEGQPKTTLCRPLAGTDAEVCNPAVLGGPGDPSESEQGRIEVRRFIADDLAVAGRYLNRFDTNDWELHGLLYFLRSEKKGLNGGIDLSVDSGDEWNARLFIGTTFSLDE